MFQRRPKKDPVAAYLESVAKVQVDTALSPEERESISRITKSVEDNARLRRETTSQALADLHSARARNHLTGRWQGLMELSKMPTHAS